MSKASGFSQRAGSRFALPISTATGEPAGIVTPATSTSRMAVRPMPVSGRLPPQPLLDRLLHQGAVVAQRGELVGVREQPEHQVARRPVRGLGTGREQQSQEGDDLVVGQALAVELGLHEHADDVTTRVGAALGDDRGEVVVEPLRRLEPPLDVDDDGDQLDGPAVELREASRGQAEHPRDDVHGEREEQLPHELGAPPVGELVDEPVDDRRAPARLPSAPSPCA